MAESGEVYCERQGVKLVFHVTGNFDFRTGNQLKELAKNQERALKYVIDLRQVKYINSSAFGVMLSLREHFDADIDNFSLINASPVVKGMLDVVNFNKLFTVV